MPIQLMVKVHSIAEDGLPARERTNVAFIFDGCIVSGWPVREDETDAYTGYWEADRDVGNHMRFSGVTHWVEFPTPLIHIGTPKSESAAQRNRCTHTHNPGVWPYTSRCIKSGGHPDAHRDRYGKQWLTSPQQDEVSE